MTEETLITVEKLGHILLIGVNRTEKMNAFTWDMFKLMNAAYLTAEEDDDVRCSVVFGHGPHFTAGLDLGEFAPHMSLGDQLVGDGDIDPWAIQGRRRTKPVVVAVHGRCLTLGIELILASDIAIAAPDTRFAQIEVKRGIFPFGGATIRFHQRAGWGNAMRYLLTGDEFDAETALRIGIVQEIHSDPRARAIAIAGTIADQAPRAVRATLENAWVALDEGPYQAAKELEPELKKLMISSDAGEGFASFIERRKANFTGT